jgi:hypothetical protein
LVSAATDIEKENLEAHVELCAQRYDALEKRLGTIEEKVSSLHITIEKSHLNTIKVLIGTAGTVIVGVLSLLGVMVTKLPQ